jgi:hypothetical protein
MRFVPLALALVLSAHFAGCVDGTPTPQAASTASASEPLVDATTGSIAGLVHDPELVPVPNVEVGIQGGESTTTDGQGMFTLNAVAPGSHALLVQALGYESAAQKVDVVAGEVLEVKISIVPIAVAEPYQLGQELVGFYNLGVCANGLTLRPGYLVFPDTERSIFETPAVDAPNMKTTIDAMTWDSTAPLSAQLFNLNHMVDGVSKSSQTKKAPIVSRIDDPEPKKKGGVINHWTWVGCTEFNQTDPTAVFSLVVQQKFMIYVNSFYHQAAPEGYTGLPG